MAALGSLHPLAARARAQARGQPARERRRACDPKCPRHVHAHQRRRVDLGRSLGGRGRVQPGRQGSAVRVCEQQGLSASDVLPDAGRGQAHLTRSRAAAMTPEHAKLDYVLRLADNGLVLAPRLSEWVGPGPILEEGIAMTNVGLDLLGQSRLWSAYAQDLEAVVAGVGRSEDQFAFLRDAREFRNLLLVEQPNGSYADTMARQFLFDQWHLLGLRALSGSSD